MEEKEQGAGEKKKEAGEEAETSPMEMDMGMMKKMMEKRMRHMGSRSEKSLQPEPDRPEEDREHEHGEPENPMPRMMAMCRDVLSSMDKTARMAAFATPELQDMFREWMEDLPERALSALKTEDGLEIDDLASRLRIRPEKAIHLATSLALREKVHLSLHLVVEEK
jgi:hypothetical protein